MNPPAAAHRSHFGSSAPGYPAALSGFMPHCTGKEMNTEGAKAAPACSVEDLLVLDGPELSMLPPAALEIWGEHPQAPLYLYPRVGTPPRGEEKLWPAWSYQTPAPKTPPTTPPRLHRDPAHWRRDQLRRKGRAYQQAHPQGPPRGPGRHCDTLPCSCSFSAARVTNPLCVLQVAVSVFVRFMVHRGGTVNVPSSTCVQSSADR